MSDIRLRKILLVANAIFLLAASTGGMIADLAGAFGGIGPQRNVLGPASRYVPGISLRLPCMFCSVPRTWSSGRSSSPPTCWRWDG